MRPSYSCLLNFWQEHPFEDPVIGEVSMDRLRNPSDIAGPDGKTSLNKPLGLYKIDLTNGVIDIASDSEVKYRLDLKTTQGLADRFASAHNRQDDKSLKKFLWSMGDSYESNSYGVER